MIQMVNGIIKCCATCEYWSGPRETTNGNASVNVDGLYFNDVRYTSKCRNPNVTYCCGKTVGNSCCGTHYRKWSELK